MIGKVEGKLWQMLKSKEVSLIMICDKEGNILWYRGRKVSGSSIDECGAFSKSAIKKLSGVRGNEDFDKNLGSLDNGLSDSSEFRDLNTNIILPINENFLLYIESGTKKFFEEVDIAVFRMMGELLNDIISDNKKKGYDTDGLIGSSKETQKLREAVEKYSLEEEPVLIIGETGVGKSYVAELIHKYSGRRGRFVVAEITSINENLFESIMFGHKKGSFTDAYADKKGLVQEAEGGTLFIDEIAEVPVSVQAKLLRFIDTEKYRVLGEFFERDADVRIISATNKDLQKAIECGEFREDLYYRLQVLGIEIPPIRDRQEDIKAFVHALGKKYLKGKEIGENFWDVMFTYEWPGNVRELMTVLKRAGIMFESPLTGEKISSIINITSKKVPHGMQEHEEKDEDVKLKEIREKINAGESFWDLIWKPFICRDFDRRKVKGILKEFYTENSFNFKKMSKSLNMDEKNYQKFISLMHQYRIDPRR